MDTGLLETFGATIQHPGEAKSGEGAEGFNRNVQPTRYHPAHIRRSFHATLSISSTQRMDFVFGQKPYRSHIHLLAASFLALGI